MNATEGMIFVNNTIDYFELAMRRSDWIISELFISIFIVTTVWFSLSMAVYVYKKGKLRGDAMKYTGNKFLLAAASVGPVTLIRFALTQAVLAVGYNKSEYNDLVCEAVEDTSIAMFALSLIPTYLYLWLRQRTFYQQPSLSMLYTKRMRVLSWGCGSFMLISGVVVAVLFIYPTAYEASENGCVLRANIKEEVFPFLATTVSLFISQIVLVGLFVYPLIIHRKVQVTMVQQIPKVRVEECSHVHSSANHKPNCVELTPSASFNHNDVTGDHSMSPQSTTTAVETLNRNKKRKVPIIKHTQGGDRVLSAIRRSVVCSVVCVVSDVTSAIILTFILPRSTPKGVTNVVYDFSLYVNILSVIFSFKNYRKIFTALYRCKQ